MLFKSTICKLFTSGSRAKMSGEQMNLYMKKFQQSSRKGEFLPDSAYKNMYKFK